MKVLSAVLLLVGVLVCYSYGQTTPVCPKFPDDTATTIKDKLNTDKFIEKSWFEVKTKNKAYGQGECTSVKYEKVLKEGSTTEIGHLKATYSFYKEKKTADNVVFLKPWAATASKYEDTFAVYTTDKLTDLYDDLSYQILTTDYTKYAVIYGCHVKETTKHERLSILTTSTDALAKSEQDKIDEVLTLLKLGSLADNDWANAEQDKAKCSASIFGLSTVLGAIVAMFLVLRN